MTFPVVSLDGAFVLEVMSQAPLFGGDTMLGYVSLQLKDATRTSRSGSQLAYRCEPLAGAKHGELVLILDYRPVERLVHTKICGVLSEWATQFRAFFLYHYWPCDKSIFRQYLKEPVDISLLLLAMSPFTVVRVMFYAVLLLCLCIPYPPDEHQIVQFILAFKGLSVFTEGIGRTCYGVAVYYYCNRVGTCAFGGAPGTGVGSVSVTFDVFQEILVLFVWIVLLPRTVRFNRRAVQGGLQRLDSTPRFGEGGADAAPPDAEETDAHRGSGGRMQNLLNYYLWCVGLVVAAFVALSASDLRAASAREGRCGQDCVWRLQENFFWCRTIFGLSTFPFFWLMVPSLNRLLTHSTPTGFTRRRRGT